MRSSLASAYVPPPTVRATERPATHLPFAEKWCRSRTDSKVPPQVQPTRSNAATTGAVGEDHPRPAPPPVEVGTGELGEHQVAAPVGVRERVHVDREAVGVGGPLRGPRTGRQA